MTASQSKRLRTSLAADPCLYKQGKASHQRGDNAGQAAAIPCQAYKPSQEVKASVTYLFESNIQENDKMTVTQEGVFLPWSILHGESTILT
jgi:hypothetical protein